MFALFVVASYGDRGGEGSFGSPFLWQWQRPCLLSRGQSVLLGDVDLQVRWKISVSSGASALVLEPHKDLVASLTSLRLGTRRTSAGGEASAFLLSQMLSKGNSFHRGWTSCLSKASFKQNVAFCVIFFSFPPSPPGVCVCFVLFCFWTGWCSVFLLIGYLCEFKLNSIPQKNHVSYLLEKRCFPPPSGRKTQRWPWY